MAGNARAVGIMKERRGGGHFRLGGVSTKAGVYLCQVVKPQPHFTVPIRFGFW